MIEKNSQFYVAFIMSRVDELKYIDLIVNYRVYEFGTPKTQSRACSPPWLEFLSKLIL